MHRENSKKKNFCKNFVTKNTKPGKKIFSEVLEKKPSFERGKHMGMKISNITRETSIAGAGIQRKSETTTKPENFGKNARPENVEVAGKALKSYTLAGKKISFGKRLEEHESWGANVKETAKDGSQQVTFKVWAPKAHTVTVEIRNPKDKISLTPAKMRAEHLQNSWAGDWNLDADGDDGKSTFVELNKGRNGVFTGEAKIPYSNGMYRYVLKDSNGKVTAKTKDPVSRAQMHIFSWSQIYDNSTFKWTDDKWMSGKNPARVSDLTRLPKNLVEKSGMKATGANGKSLLKPSNLIVKQVNIPTLTKAGSLAAAKKEIDTISKRGIYNAILLMPVEGTYGENWGYDGVDKYAVSRGVAGAKSVNNAVARNDELKELINYAHSKNLNVGMDWVPSHIFKTGPCDADTCELGITNGAKLSGNRLEDLAPYEKPGKWGGSQFNLEDPDVNVRSNVRDYVVNMPINWVKNYHVDFLRADQTPEMGSNYTMKQVAQEIRYHFPHTVIHWEDHRTQDGLTRNLTEEELPYTDLNKHLEAINKTENNKVSLYNIGGNEHWDFAFSHAVEAILSGNEVMGYNPSIRTLANNIKDIGGTKYFMSHDEIGNDSGSRLMTKVIHKDLQIADRLKNVPGESLSQRHIRGVDAVRELFLAHEFERHSTRDKKYAEICKEKGIRGLTPKEINAAVRHAKDKHKQAIGLLFMVPGSKMMFQGDSYGEINPFRFTRKQAVAEPNIEREKGYKFDEAFKESKIDSKNHVIPGILNLSQAMSDLVKRNDALQDVPAPEHLDAITPLVDEINKVLAIKRFDLNGNEVVALYNFGDRPLENYRIANPVSVLNDGTYKESINSNAKDFGGDGKYENKGTYRADTPGLSLNIPSNGFLVLEKIDKNGRFIRK